MASKTITVRVDADIKDQAEVILDDIGLSMTTLFNTCLKALVREKKVPFALISSDEYELQKTITEKIDDGGTLKEVATHVLNHAGN